MVRFLGKRRSYDRIIATMRWFTRIIEELNLSDFLLTEGSFTLCKGMSNQSLSRQDSFLEYEYWKNHFIGCYKVFCVGIEP